MKTESKRSNLGKEKKNVRQKLNRQNGICKWRALVRKVIDGRTKLMDIIGQ